MQSKLPDNLNYSEVKPVGFPSHVRQEKFIPIAFNSSSNSVGPSDIIRFNISTNGFWDPYSAYIKIEIDVSSMDGFRDLVTNGNSNGSSGSLQIDNSAQSYINQLIISKTGTEIERIEEYDTIAAMLNDMHCSADNRNSRSFEGMNQVNVSGASQYQNQIMYSPNRYNLYKPNIQMDGTNGTQVDNQYANTNSTAKRYESVLLLEDARQTVQFSDKAAIGAGITYYPVTQDSLLTTYGYKLAFCSSLSSFGNEAIMSKNILQSTTYKGQLGKYIYGDRQTFCIPLISGLLGILMPQESYKYIPMKALQDLQLEFRMNPHAMFSSGFNDPMFSSVYTTVLPTTYISRIWKIIRFDINVEMQYFESDVENIILQQLNTDKGIVLHSQSWQLGPRYQIQAGNGPNGTYQVNLGYESLKNLIFIFQPDDYITYPFCRKQFRLSANVTSYYLKIGTEYYPPLPITGHGGNPSIYCSSNNDTDANNSEYLIQLYKTFGKFNDIQQNCIINNINFAVNQRAFNPANTGTFSNLNSTNMDTAGSYPIFHENRCVGRAIYAMNLETLNQDYSVISGLNTITNRPFELNIKSDTTANTSFTRPYQLIIFCNYDMLIQIKSTSVTVLGRG